MGCNVSHSFDAPAKLVLIKNPVTCFRKLRGSVVFQNFSAPSGPVPATGGPMLNFALPAHRSRSFAALSASVLLLFAMGPQASAIYTSATPPATGPTVPGNRALLHGDIAFAPANAPESVKRAIWATNYIVRKPYVWGGGHSSFYEDGYDCSGSVSFLLRHAGLLSSPMASSELQRYGERGRGHWITVYARNGHTFATVAGLRLDTTGPRGDEGPRWRTDWRPEGGFDARHPAGM